MVASAVVVAVVVVPVVPVVVVPVGTQVVLIVVSHGSIVVAGPFEWVSI